MFNLLTPKNLVDGERISTSVERKARAIANVILVIGIILSICWIAKGFFLYFESKSGDLYYGYGGNKKQLIVDLLLPHLLTAFYYLIIAFFASMALKVLANISLSIKARGLVFGMNNVREVSQNVLVNNPQQNVASEQPQQGVEGVQTYVAGNMPQPPVAGNMPMPQPPIAGNQPPQVVP